MKKTINKISYQLLFLILVLVSIVTSPIGCKESQSADKDSELSSNKKIGVLLVNHGSHSETWRNALLQLEDNVRDSILNNKEIKGIKTAFMEYNEPSIATRLKEFDKENFSDVIIVPIFLTVSSHSFDDIPTIIGQKEDPESIEMLKLENIERYTPKAKTYITPLLDFAEVLPKNILRRVKNLTKNPDEEGLVLIAYGDKGYNEEWKALLNKTADYVKENTGIAEHSYGWCGHVAHYDPDSTTVAIREVLAKKDKALVIPVLVAHDEMFQVQIIGDGIDQIDNSAERVIYKPDSILPDSVVENWVINITKEYVEKINNDLVANRK